MSQGLVSVVLPCKGFFSRDRHWTRRPTAITPKEIIAHAHTEGRERDGAPLKYFWNISICMQGSSLSALTLGSCGRRANANRHRTMYTLILSMKQCLNALNGRQDGQIDWRESFLYFFLECGVLPLKCQYLTIKFTYINIQSMSNYQHQHTCFSRLLTSVG